MPRSDAERNRAAIVDAAARELAGSGTLDMRRVAAAARVSRSTLPPLRERGSPSPCGAAIPSPYRGWPVPPAQEISASAQELASTAEGLERLVSTFKVTA